MSWLQVIPWCPFCNLEFNSRMEVNTHFELVHPELPLPFPGAK